MPLQASNERVHLLQLGDAVAALRIDLRSPTSMVPDQKCGEIVEPLARVRKSKRNRCSTGQEWKQTGVCTAYLELSDIFEHHVDVVIKTTERAHEFLVTF